MSFNNFSEKTFHQVFNLRLFEQMYMGAKLLFCDHIFNGYGTEEKDFEKQIQKTKILAASAHQLPANFKFRYVRWFPKVNHYGFRTTILALRFASLLAGF